jgi:hypothetical protein
MRLRVVILALCGLLATGAAHAEDDQSGVNIIGLFQHICLETQGDLAAVGAAVQKDGWMRLPDEMATKISKPDFEAKQVFMKSDKSSLWMSFFFEGQYGSELKLKGCAVVIKPPLGDLSNLRLQLASLLPDTKNERDLSDLLGVPSILPKSFDSAFVWRVKDRERLPVDLHAAETKAAFAEGNIYIAALVSDQEMSGTFLINPHK